VYLERLVFGDVRSLGNSKGMMFHPLLKQFSAGTFILLSVKTYIFAAGVELMRQHDSSKLLLQ